MSRTKLPDLFDASDAPCEEVDEETLAAIDRGIRDAKAGRFVTAEEARRLLDVWIARRAGSAGSDGAACAGSG